MTYGCALVNVKDHTAESYTWPRHGTVSLTPLGLCPSNPLSLFPCRFSSFSKTCARWQTPRPKSLFPYRFSSFSMTCALVNVADRPAEIYFVSYVILTFVPPLSVMIFCYYKIFLTARKVCTTRYSWQRERYVLYCYYKIFLTARKVCTTRYSWQRERYVLYSIFQMTICSSSFVELMLWIRFETQHQVTIRLINNNGPFLLSS